MARFRPKFETKPFRYRPISTADIMPDDNAAGSMAALSNLVPNPTSENQWVCRPGAVFLPNSDTNTSLIEYYPPTLSVASMTANFRLLIPAASLPNISVPKIGVAIRIAQGSFGINILSCWIGHAAVNGSYNFDGNQVQLTFNGFPNYPNQANANPISGPAIIPTDYVTFTYNHTKDLIVAFFILNNGILNAPGSPQTNVTFYSQISTVDTSSQSAPPGAFAAAPNKAFFINWIAALQPGFAFISAIKVIGNRVYGMVANGLGQDVPFVYDLITQQTVAVSGVVPATNCPTAAPQTGAWQPPIIDNVGSKVVVAHPGFTGAGNGFFGWFDISTFASPSWHSGNTTGTALPSPPKAVRQYNNRIWYLVAGTPDVLYASDNTNFQNINTGGGGVAQQLTFGDDSPINALQTLGLHNILGGITHALLIFKANNVYQITGDFGVSGTLTTIGSLLVNSLNIAVGTQSPLSCVQTPRGVAFLSGDGMRIIDWDGKISDPIGESGKGVVQPFTQAVIPTRVCAACNGQSIRITTQNNAIVGQPYQEYVFDLELKKWHGPHTFTAALIEPWILSYITSPVGISGLWQSDIIPSTQSQFTENGMQMSFTFQTALIPNEDTTSELSMVETTVYAAGGLVPQNFTVTAQSAQGLSLDQTTIQPSVTGPSGLSEWGVMLWGRDKWFSSAQAFMNHIQIPWNKPLVFDRVQLTIGGQASPTMVIGEIRGQIEELDYTAVPG